MQFADITCYIFFTITLAVSCVDSNGEITNDRKELRLEKRYGRRDPIVMIENPVNGALQKPKVIYRRISQSQRFVPPKTKYGVPRPRYKSHKQAKYPRKPGKKFRTNHRPKHIAPKYLPRSNKHKKRNLKPRYGPPKHRPEHAHSIKQSPYSHTASGNTGFGEPPTNYANNYFPPKQSYGEPPVDSYGVPLKSTNEIPVHPSASSLQESTQQYDHQNYHPSSYPTLTNNKDTYISYSKKNPSYSKPDPDETYITTTTTPDEEFDEIDSFQIRLKDKRFSKKKPYFFDNSFRVNKPWRGKKPEFDSEIVVGGQYAEPPPRYVAKFNPSAPMFEDNEHSFVPYSEFVNRKIGSSATNSPYVNYKNSNMAFSPQNLNDAFSIV
ncbi:unnamed protein product [Arctia plantaginis]|uniref:Uncharacterized protein n=1 Tax=Arctia plantaginis TaxID=874455 RepID=A0A8S0ZVR4_ARCPL|nr:unnamed protein product [Arctia plantaginis]CAB3238159.1 unnamed protein product [Arctia plantaginis]